MQWQTILLVVLAVILGLIWFAIGAVSKLVAQILTELREIKARMGSKS